MAGLETLIEAADEISIPEKYHLYVAPPLAVNVKLGFAQFKTVLVGVTTSVGGAVLSVVVLLRVAVQPFVPVAVTVYVPAVFIVAAAVLAVKPPVPVHA